ncbi:MAG: molybdenum cofactor biosynthesis protein MoaE [Parvularculaceae bacterium]
MSSAIIVRVLQTALDSREEARAFANENRGSGAIVTFTGQVRDDGAAVEALSLEHYPGFTESRIEEIAKEADGRWRLDGLLIVHRVGKLSPSEPIVFVAAASGHRRDAFEAVDFVMDYLKSAAPFWKKEISGGKERWIEPRAEDHTDLARWSSKEASNARRR